MSLLSARGNRPLQMEFEDQLKALIYFHLEEHTSGRHLLQALKEDVFARKNVAPEAGIEKSSFFEAINSRGLGQFMEVFLALQANAARILPNEFDKFGDLVAIDGSLIDAVLSIWTAIISATKASISGRRRESTSSAGSRKARPRWFSAPTP